jgi:uncharacterized membrane protein
MDTNLLVEIWQQHSGKIIGIAAGLLIGICIIAFGLFHTLFVAICALIGYVIGKRIDEKENIVELLEKLLPQSYHR